MEIVLAHSSDLHVEDPIIPGSAGGLDGLRRVLATASALRVDALLLAGDTFDNLRVSGPVLAAARAALAACDRPVVLLPGNHDPAAEPCLYRRAGLLELAHVHVLGVQEDSVVLDGVEFVGLAHRGFSDFPPLPTARARAARWQVVLAHGHYVPPGEAQAQAHRAWRFDDAALAAVGGDYIALGHWDRALRVGDGRVAAYYSGSPDLARSLNVVRLHEQAGVTVTRHALDEVDVST